MKNISDRVEEMKKGIAEKREKTHVKNNAQKPQL